MKNIRKKTENKNRKRERRKKMEKAARGTILARARNGPRPN
jgi:hypothetical protein